MLTRNLISFSLPEEFFFFLLREIVARLSEVDDPAYGRLGTWATSIRSRPIARACRRASDNPDDADLLVGDPDDHTHLAGNGCVR